MARATQTITVSRCERHRCPPDGSGVMPCCGRTPFEVPHSDRMTLNPDEVTCGTDRIGFDVRWS